MRTGHRGSSLIYNVNDVDHARLVGCCIQDNPEGRSRRSTDDMFFYTLSYACYISKYQFLAFTVLYTVLLEEKGSMLSSSQILVTLISNMPQT